jgi:WD40-like Beta Propeller Repeat/Lysyl oxidase
MPPSRLLAICLGLVVAAAVLVAQPAQLSDAARSPGPHSAILAASLQGGAANLSDGSARTELPWLLPGDGDPAVAPDGRRIAFSSARTGNREIYVANTTTGEVRRLTASRKLEDRNPTWSPDGLRIAWQAGASDLDADLYAMRADGRKKRRLVAAPGDDIDPAWSPDGTRIAFASNRSGAYDLWIVPGEGGEEALLLDVRGAARAPAWSPDGRQLAYSGTNGKFTNIWILRLAPLATRRVTRSSHEDLRPDWSPDGHRLAFTRADRGRSRTWVLSLRNGTARSVSGTDGDVDPDWAIAAPTLAPGPEQRLPDLDQRAPSDLVAIAREGGFYLGFTSAVDNLGRGPLRIRGWRPPKAAGMRADQVIELRRRGTLVIRDVGTLRFQSHTPHRHWHFQHFESYELRRAGDHALVGRDRKSGFCLVDRYGRSSTRVPHAGPPRFLDNCGLGQPDLKRVEQGSSPGYVDRYPAFFHGQDVDISAIPAGTFVLVHRTNASRLIREERYSNDTASVRLRLTWPAGRSTLPHIVVLRRCAASEFCPA